MVHDVFWSRLRGFARAEHGPTPVAMALSGVAAGFAGCDARRERRKARVLRGGH